MAYAGQEGQHVIKQPLLELTGHASVVISCDWVHTVDQCVTASWDRTANIYDLHTGDLVVQLAGHDQVCLSILLNISALNTLITLLPLYFQSTTSILHP